MFARNVTRVRRDSLDMLIELADSKKRSVHHRLVESMDDENGHIDTDAFMSLYGDWPQVSFSLYALAIVHCYSILENNRKLICLKIPALSTKQQKNLYRIQTVKECLKSIGIIHENIRCYKTMNEFRLVNNAIKHDRYNLSTTITAKNNKRYGIKQLRSMYVNKTRHLETYLSDLYKRIL